MSAAAHNPYAFAQRPKTELEISFAISRKIARSQNMWRTVDELCQLVVQIQGIASVDLDIPGVSRQPAIPSARALATNGSAVAEVSHGGDHWGSIKIFFDAANIEAESPVRLAKFLGQQIGGLFARSFLLVEVPRRKAQNAVLSERLATRKMYSRAISILVRDRGVTEAEGREFLKSSARKLRRPIAYIANTQVSMEPEVFRIDWKRGRFPKCRLQHASPA